MSAHCPEEQLLVFDASEVGIVVGICLETCYKEKFNICRAFNLEAKMFLPIFQKSLREVQIFGVDSMNPKLRGEAPSIDFGRNLILATCMIKCFYLFLYVQDRGQNPLLRRNGRRLGPSIDFRIV